LTLLKPVSLAFAAAALIGIAGLAPAQAEPAGYSPQQNIINSHRYERLIRTDPAFREARMRKECGPITDPQLHASCVASFNRYSRG
jgi:hypothetical protein